MHYPHLRCEEWLIIAPRPPQLPWQRDTAVTIEIVREGRRHRVDRDEGTYAIARVPGEGLHRLQVDVILEATLFNQKLVPLDADAEPPPLKLLRQRMHTFALHATEGQDFDAPQFKAYLNRNGLQRRPSESEFDFAFRAFRFLGEHLVYDSEDRDKCSSHVCRSGGSDCGGLANIFVATMRANGIPAINLPGRWAASGGPKDHDQCHVKSAFFDPHLGWVKVDQNGAVAQHKKDKEIGFQNFATGGANFLTFSTIHPPHLDLERFGEVSLNGIGQGVIIKVDGKGSDRDHKRTATWTVEKEDVK